ncbi:MAG TPA: alanine racemase [Candidatus Onthocola gallistercoris]|uniref:Alanine racemase n=1 Tax=Candidatus Onthocola gallistercoris TaxID=2840876 RepID=A0A9D1KWY1_9FIRM|nr:alanine racemase [Candidatus Onthocola gallistercoris]
MNQKEEGSLYRICACIDLDALRQNIKNIRSKLTVQTKLMCVIKTDAYGHGAVTVAETMQDSGADWFAVAAADEGIELRKAGIKKPILVLGYTCKEQYDTMIANHIVPTIFTLQMAKDFNAAAQKAGKQIDIHIALDTGMSRIGFLPDDGSMDAIEEISHLPYLNIQGVFTHFACADMADKTHMNGQIRVFGQMLEEMHKRHITPALCHCANSAAIMERPEVQMDMVRAGIIQYGLYPSDEVDPALLSLQPVMSLWSHVAYIKELPAGVGVSYGATYVTSKPTKVATIPVGYGDGYPRSLSNKGYVLIRGQKAPIIGRVCMDQMMVDITGLKGIQERDLVCLMGRDGDENISAEELADMAGSFNYEFVCDVGRRVPRVYIKEGKQVKVVNYLID